jgi:hypothetical protein
MALCLEGIFYMPQNRGLIEDLNRFIIAQSRYNRLLNQKNFYEKPGVLN